MDFTADVSFNDPPPSTTASSGIMQYPPSTGETLSYAPMDYVSTTGEMEYSTSTAAMQYSTATGAMQYSDYGQMYSSSYGAMSAGQEYSQKMMDQVMLEQDIITRKMSNGNVAQPKASGKSKKVSSLKEHLRKGIH